MTELIERINVAGNFIDYTVLESYHNKRKYDLLRFNNGDRPEFSLINVVLYDNTYNTIVAEFKLNSSIKKEITILQHNGLMQMDFVEVYCTIFLVKDYIVVTQNTTLTVYDMGFLTVAQIQLSDGHSGIMFRDDCFFIKSNTTDIYDYVNFKKRATIGSLYTITPLITNDFIIVLVNEMHYIFNIKKNTYKPIEGKPYKLERTVNRLHIITKHNGIEIVDLIQEPECCFCFEEQHFKTHAIVPCGHTDICESCVKKVSAKCPICNTVVQTIVKLH